MHKAYNYVFIIICVVIVLTSFFQNCGDSGTHPDDLSFVFPDTMISFNTHVKPMLEAKCTTKDGCHSPGDVNPLNYSAMLNRDQFIHHPLSRTGEILVNLNLYKNQPELSMLYLILSIGYPVEYDDKMPPYDSGYSINSNQLSGIQQWIREGAKE